MTAHSLNAKAELRVSRRVIFHRRALLNVAGQTIRAKTVDINLDGCGIIIQVPVKDELTCTLTIFANCDGVPAEISATGRVIYCILSGTLGYQVGIHFSQLNSANKELINRVIARAY
jgi:hypothetical protein